MNRVIWFQSFAKLNPSYNVLIDILDLYHTKQFVLNTSLQSVLCTEHMLENFKIVLACTLDLKKWNISFDHISKRQVVWCFAKFRISIYRTKTFFLYICIIYGFPELIFLFKLKEHIGFVIHFCLIGFKCIYLEMAALQKSKTFFRF